MPRKLTKEEFINREPDLLNGEYEMLVDYVGVAVKTLFRHNLCGSEWMITPANFHQGRRCPKCAILNTRNKLSLTKEEFCKREKDILSGEYLIMGAYKDTRTKALFKHNICGYKWKINPSNFHKGQRCPRCAIRKQTLTKEVFIEREDDIQSGEYLMIGRYINSHTKTLFRHNTCGYEWMITPIRFHTGRRCPKCANQRNGLLKRLTKEEFVNRELDLLNGRYSMLGEYITTDTKTLFKHDVCDYEWMVTPDSFHRGNRCPKCKESKGEKKISKVLEEINIPFEAQKRFDSCRYKNTLPFDFYVNNSFLVEYDGEQHFKPVDFTGKGNEWADKSFKSGQLRDSIKTQWAKDNGIPLVRIPYTEFDNIEQIIKDNIEKYSIQKAG